MISGQKLREYRELKGVQPAAVAEAMGEPRQRVYQIERAESPVTLEVAEKFINAVEKLVAPREGRPARKLELRVGLYMDGAGPYEGDPLTYTRKGVPLGKQRRFAW